MHVTLYCRDKHIIIFVCDQSSCRTKYDDHALLVKNKDGGPCRVLDTVWEGSVWEVVFPDGYVKGLRRSDTNESREHKNSAEQ